MDARAVLIEPVISEKSYALMAEGKYTFRVHQRATKPQIRHAVEEVFDVRVAEVRTPTTCTSKISSTAFAIWVLCARSATRKVYLPSAIRA